MDPQQQGSTQLPPLPTKSGDTYSYKGWLISDSFLKRAFAVLGYNMVAGLILYIPLVILMSFVVGSIFSAMAPAMMQPGMQGDMMQMPPAPMPMGEMMNPGMAGKLDINEICNGALASMTFESGEAADAFVQECIAGEHPEVVQNYMQMMQSENGMMDGAAI